ncbi:MULTISPECIES: GTP cyclohydrolase II [Cytobacillus]|uniref:GTP cyclohydrolase II n=1 Tax=Cytobacillus kochii TaxID=859143 RepID=A0A248TGH2_9BACI|nr:GTP cyclohydrolase II [Cytobacillus kochii]ASV67307.1 GTP cyclohydrolase [Cytobacillus kochii]MDM5205848.1 GTP cyclohydrolase II [Cytobacillus kochii]MDQ0185507.1 GTP cyclohydrolase II [Cytobacillus kochii]
MNQINIETKAIEILEKKIQRIDRGDRSVYLVGPIRLPVNLDGETVHFKWYCWLDSAEVMEDTSKIVAHLSSANLADSQQSSVLVYGDFEDSEDALVRFHSICHTGDIFGSKRCDCGYQLKQSMKMMVANGSGALFYLANHEGRGIGLFSKAMAYVLQENGYDTVEANEELGFVDDSRKYDEAITVLQQLRKKPITLITNNPKKLDALTDAGALLVGRTPLWGDISDFNEKYLQTKVLKSGHLQAEGVSRDE